MKFYYLSLPIIFCVSLILPTLSVSLEATRLDHIVAIVNDDVILSSQLEERSQLIYHQLSQQRQNLPPLSSIKTQVLERLILENIQLQLAQRASIKLSNDELQAALAGIARQNGINLKELESHVEKEGISFSAFKRNIENEILLQRIQQIAVSKRVEISEQDITNFLNSEEGKIKFSNAYHIAHIALNYSVNADDTEKEKIHKLAESIEDRLHKGSSFEEMAKKYSGAIDAISGGDLGWRTTRDIPSLYADTIMSLSKGEISKPIVANDGIYILKLLNKQGKKDQWIQQTRVRHILVKTSIIRNDQEAEELLSELRKRILAGENFAELAIKFSEDYGSALKGGDLGWTTPGQLAPQFQQVMDDSAVDTISFPFQSQYGWHILQVQERRNENLTEELVRQSVRNYLTKQKFETELPIWLQELRAEAYVVIKDPALQTNFQ